MKLKSTNLFLYIFFLWMIGTFASQVSAQWSSVASPTTEVLRGVDPVDTSLAFIVGGNPTIFPDPPGSSKILRWNGSALSALPSPVSSTIEGVDMVSATDGWAVTRSFEFRGSALLRWNGNEWAIHAQIPGNIRAIRMLNANFGLTAGSSLSRWNGTSWDGAGGIATSGPNVDADYWSIDIVDANNAWMVGNRRVPAPGTGPGIIARWTGSEWTEVLTFPGVGRLVGVSMVSLFDGWAVSELGKILRWNGTNWSPVASPTTFELRAVHALSSSNAWAVGQNGGFGGVFHWDGTSWKVVSSPANFLLAVRMLNANEGWAVGHGGQVLRFGSISLTSTRSDITITALADTDPLVAGALEIAKDVQGLEKVSIIFDISPNGATFDPPATLTFRYTDDPLNEVNFKIFRFNGATSTWEEVNPGQQINNFLGNFISVGITSLSLYAVFKPIADIFPPRTALTLSGPFFVGISTFVSAETSFTLTSVDDSTRVGDAKGKGVNLLNVILDGHNFASFENPSPSPDQAFSATFSLAGVADGAHTLSFFGTDTAGNTETAKDFLVSLDNTAPVVTLSTPQGGETFIATKSTITISFSVSDAQDPSPISTATLRLTQAKDPAKAGTTIVVQNGDAIDPKSIPAGFYILEISASDFVGNTSTKATGSFEVLHDILPPRTNVSAGLPNFSQQPTFISSETLISLSSVDDMLQMGDIQGLGVKEIRASLDSGAFVVFPATFTSFTLSSLSPNVPEGNHTLRFLSEDLAGNIETEQTLSVFLDVSSPDSNLTIGSPSAMVSGEQFVSTLTAIGFSSQDNPPGGSGVDQIQFRISNLEFQDFTSSFALSEGKHTIAFFAEDNLQHKESPQVSTISADGTAPTTTLTISGPNAEPNLVSAQTQFSLSAIDPVSNNVVSGVDEIQFRISDFGFRNFTSPFSLSAPDGVKTIEFFSRDKVQNQPPTPNLQSFELDTTAPQIQLVSPSLSNQGVCRVVKGNVSVVGIIFDSHIQSWTLEAAPFQDAQFGFTLISSGTTNASKPSLLAMWDTNSLSGHVTLRLTATDLVGNASFTQVSLFVGDPELSLSISGGLLNKPSGIAVRGDGEFWVSDTNHNKLRKFSSSGALLQTIESGFNKPKGLALDSSGNIYIADTNNNRIVKLNINGIFLRDFGRKGSAPGEFNKPTSIALDSKGNMYIADRNNGRIQKLNSQGHFLMDFVAASMSPTFGEDEDDFDEIDSAPFGVALDSNENVYASNEKRDEIVIFSPLGMVLKTITGFKKPQGINIFQDYLYVADRNNSRVQKFDTLQLPVLTFGGDTQKPTALAADSQGNLYLADRNNDSVKVFRFPTGSPPLFVMLEKEKEKPKEEARKPEEKGEEKNDNSPSPQSSPEIPLNPPFSKGEVFLKGEEVPAQTASTSLVEGSTATTPSQTVSASSHPEVAPSSPSASSPQPPSGTPIQPVSSTTAPSPQESQTPAPQTEAPPASPEDPDSALHLADEDVKVTPENPKPGQNITFHIEPGGAEMVELVVSDEKGNTIHQETTAAAPLEGSRHKVNLHWETQKDLPEGQYLYLLRAHKGSETQKVLRTFVISSRKDYGKD